LKLRKLERVEFVFDY